MRSEIVLGPGGWLGGKMAWVTMGTIAGRVHVTPHGVQVITSLIQNGGINRTFTVLGFAPGINSHMIRGALHDTITGTRRGGSVSITGLFVSRVFISRSSAVGHVRPHDHKRTFGVLGRSDRLAIIISRGTWKKG